MHINRAKWATTNWNIEFIQLLHSNRTWLLFMACMCSSVLTHNTGRVMKISYAQMAHRSSRVNRRNIFFYGITETWISLNMSYNPIEGLNGNFDLHVPFEWQTKRSRICLYMYMGRKRCRERKMEENVCLTHTLFGLIIKNTRLVLGTASHQVNW